MRTFLYVSICRNIHTKLGTGIIQMVIGRLTGPMDDSFQLFL